jgi:NifU-like protein involved in Fe-S cluster formation
MMRRFAQDCGIKGAEMKAIWQVRAELEALPDLQSRPTAKEDTYTARLLRYWDRDLQGRIENPTHTADIEHAQCDDWVRMTAIIENGTVEKLEFQAGGCCLSECCAAFVAQNLEGLDIAQLEPFDFEDLMMYLNIKLQPDRKECAMLGLNCLRKLINEET